MPRFNKDDYEERIPQKIEEGDYPFSVVKAEEKTSSNGNQMITLEMQFDIGAEKPMTVFGYLVFTQNALYKIKGFCDATGLTEKWYAEALDAEDCLGAEGKAHLFLGQAKENGNRYMEVKYYCKPDSLSEDTTKNNLTFSQQEKLEKARSIVKGSEPVAPKYGPSLEDDDIPF